MAEVKPIPAEFLADPNRYFTEWLPKAIAERGDLSEKVGTTSAIAQIQLDGDLGGAWHFVVKDGAVSVAAGQHAQPSFTLRMDVDTWRKMRLGEVKPQVAFLTGKVKIKGNAGLALKLAPLFR